MHIGQVVIDASIESKIRSKHGITGAEVCMALMWPANAQAAWEDHPEHGRRVVAMGMGITGRRVLAVLLPMPEWDDHTDTWVLKTARWV